MIIDSIQSLGKNKEELSLDRKNFRYDLEYMEKELRQEMMVNEYV